MPATSTMKRDRHGLSEAAAGASDLCGLQTSTKKPSIFSVTDNCMTGFQPFAYPETNALCSTQSGPLSVLCHFTTVMMIEFAFSL
ncbi:hypothetical protein IF2G_02253 [Cordyceps javanica]|nr:hypothetical protein IF2G_02253 [Cordyceps javanica]